MGKRTIQAIEQTAGEKSLYVLADGDTFYFVKTSQGWLCENVRESAESISVNRTYLGEQQADICIWNPGGLPPRHYVSDSLGAGYQDLAESDYEYYKLTILDEPMEIEDGITNPFELLYTECEEMDYCGICKEHVDAGDPCQHFSRYASREDCVGGDEWCESVTRSAFERLFMISPIAAQKFAAFGIRSPCSSIPLLGWRGSTSFSSNGLAIGSADGDGCCQSDTTGNCRDNEKIDCGKKLSWLAPSTSSR